MERIFRQKCIPGDTNGFRKFKETTNSVEQELKREKSIQRKSGLKKKMELERGMEESRKKKKMNVPIEMKTRLDAAERREDRPKTIGQVELNTEIAKKMTFKMCFLKATKI